MIENKKYIHWMALFGLVVIIGLQGVWLYSLSGCKGCGCIIRSMC